MAESNVDKAQVDEKLINEQLSRLESKIEILSQQVIGSLKRIYTSEEVRKIFTISKRCLQKWRDDGLISYSQFNGVVRYSEDDIQEFMHKYKHKSRK